METTQQTHRTISRLLLSLSLTAMTRCSSNFVTDYLEKLQVTDIDIGLLLSNRQLPVESTVFISLFITFQ